MAKLQNPPGYTDAWDTPDRADGAGDGWSVVRLLSVVLRRPGLIVASAAVAFLIAVLPPLLSPRQYTSSASFVLQSRRSGGNLGGLAAQLGLSTLSLDGGQSPQLYADLATAPDVLGGAVDATYRFPTDSGEFVGTLVTALHAAGPDAALRRDAAMRALAKRVKANVSTKTGIVTLSVTTASPQLSTQVADRVLGLVTDLNMRTRQAQASAERKFTESRLRDARRELENAETRMRAFLEQNRQYQASPYLLYEFERLSREASMHQQVYSTLAQSYEQARIEELRDTPVIAVMQPPRVPVRPDARGLIGKGLLGLVLGSMAGVGLAILLAYRERLPLVDRAGYEELADAWRSVRRVVPGRRRAASAAERA